MSTSKNVLNSTVLNQLVEISSKLKLNNLHKLKPRAIFTKLLYENIVPGKFCEYGLSMSHGNKKIKGPNFALLRK